MSLVSGWCNGQTPKHAPACKSSGCPCDCHPPTDPTSGVNAGPAASSFPPPGTDAVPDEAKQARDPHDPADPAAPEVVLPARRKENA